MYSMTKKNVATNPKDNAQIMCGHLRVRVSRVSRQPNWRLNTVAVLGQPWL